jgi:hypothetical protein
MRQLLLITTVLAIGLALPQRVGHAVPDRQQTPRTRVAPDLEVVEAVFGYVDAQTGKIVESSVIDTAKHRGFGWRIRFDGLRRSVRFREEFILPAPARSWQVGPETTVAPDRASATTEGDRHLDSDLKLRNAWIHTPGDPTGPHITRVWVEGTLVAEFRYRLK